jgi:drug/metabolite transporter (DMT)-like permease
MSHSQALLNHSEDDSTAQATGQVDDAKKDEATAHVSLATGLGLAAAILLDTAAELLWKAGVIQTGECTDIWPTLCGAAKQPLFILAMLLFIPKYFNWMFVLSRADLTFAKPITSLSYVTVLVFSALFLHEPITTFKVAGLVLILCGVWQVSRTEVSTIPGTEK